MGHLVSIETITNGKERFACEVESEGLYKINIAGHIVESPDLIYQICIFNDIIVLLTDCRKDNNITAYDFRGNFLWNIKSITGDIMMPFTYVSCLFKADAERKLDFKLPPRTKLILECIAEDFVFVVDPEKRKLLCKLGGRIL